VVSVRDTGCGMDEATLGRLFDVFFTTKQGGKAAGLGLPMVYGFVKESDGQVEVESQPGAGTTVRMYFPLWQEAPHRAEERAEAPSASRPDRTVLAVEDEQEVRMLLAEILRGARFRVREAGSADEALAILAGGERVDLLLTDVVMPGRSGVELAREVRKAHPDLPVLFVSGYPEGDLQKRGVTIGRAELLTKPCSRNELLGKIGRMFGDPGAPAAG